MKDFAAIDFETANDNASSVCSVGVVVVREGDVVEKFYELIRPAPNFYHFFNTRIHGLSASDTATADDFPDVWARIEPLVDGLPLVAHNSPFDAGCLRAVHAHYGMVYPDYTFFCTCRAARRAYPRLINHKLHTVASHVGFDLHDHHHALADAEACAAIAMKVLFD